jgi:preprotein translocase subunit SecD
MKTISDLLRDADPLRHEPRRLEGERDRLLQAVVSATSDVAAPSRAWFRTPAVLLAIATLAILAIVAVGSQIWPQGGAALQAAAVRFEVRLAEDHQAADLQEARVSGSDRVVYLHQEVIVTNGDIAQSRVVNGNDSSHFGVGVEFNEAGAQKMRQATANHVGRPMAILIDGAVVMAPVLRARISTSAVISGDLTQAEAERIVNGISIR